MEAAALLAAVKWNADGLVPVVIADARTGAVLTLAYANREHLKKPSRQVDLALQPFARGALEQGRDVGQHAARGGDRDRLR